MKAELINSMGSDLTVVNAARVSFDKESEWEGETYEVEVDYGPYDPRFPGIPEGRRVEVRHKERRRLSRSDNRLINYLATHNHFTPFTHCMITLRETVPIFVARQRFKSTIGFSYNEVSRRYVDNEPEFFLPIAGWRGKAKDKKQGSSEVIIDMDDFDKSKVLPKRLYDIALDTYNELLRIGAAPELARMVLPQSMYTSYYVTGSLAAFARSYNLRSSPDAQLEIRELANQWDSIIRPLFPVSWDALTSSPSQH